MPTQTKGALGSARMLANLVVGLGILGGTGISQTFQLDLCDLFVLAIINSCLSMNTQGLKPLFHSSQKPTRKLAASAFKYCDWMKVLTASLRELAFAMSGKEA